MGTPYYSSKATTKTASLISSSGGSSSPSKTSSSKPSSTSQSPSGGYLKSTEVNVKLDESGREVSRTTTVTSGGVSTQTSQTLKSAGKEVVQPGSKLVKGGSTSAPTPPGYLQTKEKVVVQPGKRLQPPYPSELESFLAQAGPSPDHPAYISSQRFLAPGTNLPIFVSDINLPEGEGVKGQGRRLIEQRLEEAYGLTRGYEYADVQLDTDPELERIFYPVGLFPKGAKLTGASIEEIKVERPKLIGAEEEYKQKYSPGVQETVQTLGFEIEVPAEKMSEFPMSMATPDLTSGITEAGYFYYTEDHPNFKGQGVTVFSPSATPASELKTVKFLGYGNLIPQFYFTQPGDIKGQELKSLWKSAFGADVEAPVTVSSGGVISPIKTNKWSLGGDAEQIRFSTQYGDVFYTKGEFLGDIAEDIQIASQFAAQRQRELKEGKEISSDTFGMMLSGWDIGIDTTDFFYYLSSGSKRMRQQVTSAINKVDTKFGGISALGSVMEFGLSGAEAFITFPEYSLKAAGRAFIPVTYMIKKTSEGGDPLKAAGEVATVYTIYAGQVGLGLGGLALAAYKKPEIGVKAISGIAGSMYAYGYIFYGLQKGLGVLKEKFMPSKTEFKFMSKAELDKMNADWAAKKPQYEAELRAGEVIARQNYIKNLMTETKINKPPSITEQIKAAVWTKADQSAFFAFEAYKGPEQLANYRSFWFKIWKYESEISNFLSPIRQPGSTIVMPYDKASITTQLIAKSGGLFQETSLYTAPGSIIGAGPSGTKVVERVAFASTKLKAGSILSNIASVSYGMGKGVDISLIKQTSPPISTVKSTLVGPLGYIKDTRTPEKIRYHQEAKIEAYEMANIEDALRNPTRDMFKEQLRMEQKYGTRNVTGVGVGIGTRVRTYPIQAISQEQGIRQRVGNIPYVGVRSMIGQKSMIGQNVRIGMRFRQKIPEPPKIFPLPGFATEDEGKRGGRGRRKKLIEGYAGTPPSFTAIIGNIRGGKVSKKSLISGIGIRPITKGWFGKGRRII